MLADTLNYKMRLVRLLRFQNPQPYEAILDLQARIVRQKLSNRTESKDYLLLLEHEPVITMGRRSHVQSINSRLPVHKSNRGGQVTYHGPGQLVAYPILDLVRFRQSLLWYTESLGAVMTEAVRTCFGLDAFYDSCPDRVGLWLSDREKLGFIGIQCQRWIVSHGCSVNLKKESLVGFNDIDPCGLGKAVNIACCEERMGSQGVNREIFEKSFIESFETIFDCKVVQQCDRHEPQHNKA